MKTIGVLTSGGDAPGMNAAVRAVVRTALDHDLQVYAIYEGYQGMVDGGGRIQPMLWKSVGGILHRGGTIIGSARCDRFKDRNGRLQAARNLIHNSIEALIIIGGDGSLTGAQALQSEWPGLLRDLQASGDISPEQAERHQHLPIVGLIGSIDNDMWGTDMTIGADTALHRIVDAVDAITSTAASHQRTFVVEVMGRRCGYLALMGALATGADWVLIPENPPDVEDWEGKMCAVLRKGREVGRRDSIVIVAEGAHDRHGRPISSQYVRQVLEERLNVDVRVTVLGHVQRGGSPSAFDRNLSTLSGAAAVAELLSAERRTEPCVIGLDGNKIRAVSLSRCLTQTWEVEKAVQAQEFSRAMSLRGHSFSESFQIVRTLVRALPHPVESGRRLRMGVMHAGGPAPGMNTAVRAAVRLGVDKGHTMLGVRNGFRGLAQDEIRELAWMDVAGFTSRGGAELGTNRHVPEGGEFYAIARNLEKHRFEGLLIIGGWSGYQAALELHQRREEFPAFNIPIVCLPATINNNLPGA